MREVPRTARLWNVIFSFSVTQLRDWTWGNQLISCKGCLMNWEKVIVCHFDTKRILDNLHEYLTDIFQIYYSTWLLLGQIKPNNHPKLPGAINEPSSSWDPQKGIIVKQASKSLRCDWNHVRWRRWTTLQLSHHHARVLITTRPSRSTLNDKHDTTNATSIKLRNDAVGFFF